MSASFSRGQLQYFSPGPDLDLPRDMKTRLRNYFSRTRHILRAYFICVSRSKVKRGFQLAVELEGDSPLLVVSEEDNALMKRINRDTKKLIKTSAHFGVLIVNNLDSWLGPGGKHKFISAAEILFDADGKKRGHH